jgi:protein O-mannosyl-transferase
MPHRTPKSGAGARVKSEAPKPGFFRLPLAVPVALLLLTVLVYARSLGTPIHDWDDNIYFFRDARVEHLSAENVQRILTQPFFSNYHPVTTLTIAFDRAVWGTWVPGFHLTQLFFYAGGVLGIYFLFVRILRRRAEAFVAAAIYAAHAVHVESVAWLASRKDVVCLFFYVFALLAYVRYTGAASHRWRPYALSFLLSGVAMLSKGYAVILPALFVAYDLCFAPRITRRQLLDKIPIVALTAAMTLLTVYAQDKQSGLVDLSLSVAQRIARLGEVLALYAGHTILPIRLSAIYTTGITPPKIHLAVTGIALAAAMVAGFLAWRRRLPAAAFGIALFALPLATVMNVYYTLRIWMTDRYLLFPTIGSSLFLVAVAASFYPTKGARVDARRAVMRRGLAWVAAFTIVLYSALTVARIGVWTSDVRLWSDVLRRQLDLPGSGPVTATALAGARERLPDPGPIIALRRAYQAQGNSDEAARLESLADSLSGGGDEHSLMKLARLDLAGGRYADALGRLRPVAEGRTWFAPLAMFRIGVAEEKLGHVDASRQAYRRALEMYRELSQPATDAYFEVGTMEYLAGNYAKAAEWYRLASRESPREGDAVFHLGLALQQSGQVPEAMALYQRILSGELRFTPHSRMSIADVYLQMGTASEMLGRKQDAVRYFREVLRRDPSYPKGEAVRAKIAALSQ